MSDSAIIVRDGDESHRLATTHRDWGLLFGPGFAEGPHFVAVFGVYEHFSVARGVPKDSQVTRRGADLHEAAQVLLSGVERDAELLRHDYTFSFADTPTRYSAGQSVTIRGRAGIISARPRGYCTIELLSRGEKDPDIAAEVIDLRVTRDLATDDRGIVKVQRRKAEMHWLETLPPLLHFLGTRLPKDLVVEHIGRI